MKIIYPNLKSIIYIWIFFAILPILSCSKPLNNPIQHFSSDQREMLTHSRIIDLEEFNILKPGAVIRKDDSYMFWDINNPQIRKQLNCNFGTNFYVRICICF